MPCLIDSDWVIDHLNDTGAASELLSDLAGEEQFISVMTYLEVFQGTLRAANPGSTGQRLSRFIEDVPILDVTQAVAERCARIRQHLLDQGRRPNRRAFDLVIAATAVEYGLTLVTRNVRDYLDVPGLKLHEL